MKPPQYYSRFAKTSATRGGNLPHWSQWCATFTTFRLADSLPEGKLEQMRAERDAWIRAHVDAVSHRVKPVDAESLRVHEGGRHVDAESLRVNKDEQTPPDAVRHRVHEGGGMWTRSPSASLASTLSAADLAEYRELFSERFHSWLDAGHGSCVLRDPKAREAVEAALRHFADKHYSLYGFVVMPNHVHALFMPEEGFDSREVVAGWKRYTAHAVNRALGRCGALWQKESYDHLVRDVEEFNAYRAYIRRNDPTLAFDAYLK